MDGMSLYPLLKNETQYTRDSFMIEYHGEGKVGNYQKCGDVIEDMYNLAICEPEWGCKCQDSRNNTYNCLRTMTNTENTLFCAFEDDVGHLEFYNLEEALEFRSFVYCELIATFSISSNVDFPRINQK